ncbi:eukaryotic translation initiation factor 5A-1-like isoform X3 [Branchiostoma floridae]|uniref:Eukaryotic translation initiation factor 5A n=1 Tax=Branchiostoma floridae TaxID=7739 RepID=A0A9J7L073_BRAFL|nr:eukaryotic translation initiation factor 5A-1-like isoform X2 [Branchiostoma floridae]XP_035672939.1 eukaryotic translation initiation factor 5A-1-like isoform X3 [Branchiostoma floridae]
MSDALEADFGSGDEAGAKPTYTAQASSLRQNGHVMLKDRPCKITEITTTTEGKHGHSKVTIVGVDIFTGDEYEDVVPSTQNLDVPNVSRKDYRLTNIEDGFLHLMDYGLMDCGDMKADLKVPGGDLGNEIQSRFDNGVEFMVTVLSACGEEKAIAIKKIA